MAKSKEVLFAGRPVAEAVAVVDYLVATKKANDLILKAPHYNAHPSGVECIRIVEHYNFNLGNCIKYIWRSGLKDSAKDLEDLKKARYYLDNEIQLREKNNPLGSKTA